MQQVPQSDQTRVALLARGVLLAVIKPAIGLQNLRVDAERPDAGGNRRWAANLFISGIRKVFPRRPTLRIFWYCSYTGNCIPRFFLSWFSSLPAIFAFLPGGNYLGFLWFILLFLAAFTSIVAMAQPMIAFLEDEIGMTREKAAILLGIFWFLSSHLCIYLRGGWQVMDFWAGTFGPPLLALTEVIIIMWIFGGKRIWDEMHRGSQIRAPLFFYFTAKYITPLFLGLIFMAWSYQNITLPILKGTIFQRALEGVDMGWAVWIICIFLIVLFISMCIMVHLVWKHRRKEVTK